MDRQAQFFIDPKFDEDFVDRERKAVDSEFNTHMKDDTWRLYHVLKQLVNPLHPFSRFTVGNLETLPGGNKSVELRDAAIQFYSTFYTLNRMNLGVGGPQTLDELEAMAEKTYGKIWRRGWDGKGRLDNGASVGLFPFAFLRRRVQIQTVSETQNLHLIFSMPDLMKFYRSKPELYVQFMISNRNRGGFFDSLKKEKRWIDTFLADYQRINSRDGLFDISFDLTPEGLKHIDEIIDTVEISKIRAIASIFKVHEVQYLRSTRFNFEVQFLRIHLTKKCLRSNLSNLLKLRTEVF